MAEKKPERRGLGRGLSALMADVAPVETENPQPERGPVAERMIPIEKVRPNENQPRKDFGSDQLEDLTNSIREKGIIQPLILRELPGEAGIYQIVAGERRWRAAQSAQLHEIPAIVRDYSETEVLEIAIIENIQRAELNAMEEAAGYRQLMDRFGHTQDRIADALGKSRSHIANLLRLLNLPESIQNMVREGALTAGHARALVTAENPEALAREIARKGLSVREAERLAKPAGRPKLKKGAKTAERNADTVALEGDLSAALRMSVHLDHKEGEQAGKLTISYKSLDELDRICNILSAPR